MTSVTSNATYAGAPGVPEAAKFKTDAGAIAFAKHYYQRVNALGRQPASGSLLPLSAASCNVCRKQDNSIKKLGADGRRYTTDIAKIEGARIEPSSASRLVRLDFFQGEVQIADRTGQIVKTIPAQGKYTKVVYLDWTSTGWRLADIKGVS